MYGGGGGGGGGNATSNKRGGTFYRFDVCVGFLHIAQVLRTQ